MSNYHGCKGEAIKLIPHYSIYVIYKIVKSSHLEKLQIIQNINNLMFQVIFIFSYWILMKQIIVFSTTFYLGKTDFQKVLPGVLSGELEYELKCIDSMHFLGMWTPKIEKIFPHTVEYTS